MACIALLCAAGIARADDKVTYDDHVAAILRQRCGSCHNPTAKKADLDVTNFVGPTVFPDVAKRRVAGTIYLVLAAGCVAQWSQSSNDGVLAVGALLTLIGAYHFVAGWRLKVNETDALVIASHVEIDLHEAAELLRKGCPPELVVPILA